MFLIKCLPKTLISGFFVVSFVFCSQPEEYPATFSVENGVTLVTSPSFPKQGAETVRLEEVLSIGTENGDENNRFFNVVDITVASNGDIYTVDYGDKLIRVFDKEGTFKRTIGSKGQGPGEFAEPFRLIIDSTGDIFLLDLGNGVRVTHFSSSGEYIKDFRIGNGRRLIGIDNDGMLYITKRNSWDRATGKEERIFEKVDHEGKLLQTLGQFTGQDGTPTNGGRGAWRSGYEHGALNYAVYKNGDLLIGASDNYVFSVYDKFGNLKRKFGRQHEAIQLTENEASKLTRDPERRKLLPATKPAFKMENFSPLIDSDNNFWILTFERENEGMTYDIFSEDGVYLKKVFFEFTYRRLKPMVFHENILYAVHIDDNGFNRVRGYRLRYQ